MPRRKVVLVSAFNGAIRLPKFRVTMCSSGSCILLFRGHFPVPRTPKSIRESSQTRLSTQYLSGRKWVRRGSHCRKVFDLFWPPTLQSESPNITCCIVFVSGIFHFCCFGKPVACSGFHNPSGIVPNKVQNQICIRESDLEVYCIVARSSLTGFGFQRCNANP